MDKIRIVYIDDDLDTNISRYMTETYEIKESEKSQKCYKEVCFDSKSGYESLINNEYVKEANIVLIDSKLFENENVTSGKFSGEEFKMILKKIFPFIEVIVITQNALEEEYGTISKFKGKYNENPQEYYDRNLKGILDSAVKNVKIYRNIADKLKINKEIDKALIEKILNSLDGISQYDELTKNDIDSIIEIFKGIEREINEQ